MNKEPTAKQLKKFWEWCGFELEIVSFNTDPADLGGKRECTVDHWHYGANLWTVFPPTIDLNNLFKYAVPKLIELGYHLELCDTTKPNEYRVAIKDRSFSLVGNLWWDNDPALALFWAIEKLIDGESL
ncbi:unnamed protein product [marine sediment metagenome]|uniref:Phage ABA sandwich domain-containing protein n=1 Tax=marine sediment metagenome TaxID=412755 RepID=X1C306_9ZZZZ